MAEGPWIKEVLVSSTDPMTSFPSGWVYSGAVWFDTTEKKFKQRSGSSWTLMVPEDFATDDDIATAIATHASNADAHHPAHAGLTGARVIDGKTLTFTNGLLTGYSA